MAGKHGNHFCCMALDMYFAALKAVSLRSKLIKNVCGPNPYGPHFVQKHKTTFLTTKGRNLLIASVCAANDLCLKNPPKALPLESA